MYVVTNPAWPDYVKIGVTVRNPTRRLGQFNVGDPHRAFMYAALVTVANAKEAEAHVHDALAESRVKGEWFRITPEKAVAFVQTLALP